MSTEVLLAIPLVYPRLVYPWEDLVWIYALRATQPQCVVQAPTGRLPDVVRFLSVNGACNVLLYNHKTNYFH